MMWVLGGDNSDDGNQVSKPTQPLVNQSSTPILKKQENTQSQDVKDRVYNIDVGASNVDQTSVPAVKDGGISNPVDINDEQHLDMENLDEEEQEEKDATADKDLISDSGSADDDLDSTSEYPARGLNDLSSETRKRWIDWVTGLDLPAIMRPVSMLYGLFMVMLSFAFSMAEALPRTNITPTQYKMYLSVLLITGVIWLIVMITLGALNHLSTSDEYKAKKFNKTGFIKAGALVFGLGSCLYDALGLIDFAASSSDSSCSHIVLFIQPFSYVIMALLQTYVILIYIKVRIDKFTLLRAVARFGMIHLFSVNISIWLMVLVDETKESINKHYDKAADELMGERSNYVALDKLLAAGGSIVCNTSQFYLMPPHFSLPPFLKSEIEPIHPSTVGGVRWQHRSEEAAVTAAAMKLIQHIAPTAPQFTINSSYQPSFCYRVGESRIESSVVGKNCSRLRGGYQEIFESYLYPCKIEYSLIMASLLFSIWNRIPMRHYSDNPDTHTSGGTSGAGGSSAAAHDDHNGHGGGTGASLYQQTQRRFRQDSANVQDSYADFAACYNMQQAGDGAGGGGRRITKQESLTEMVNFATAPPPAVSNRVKFSLQDSGGLNRLSSNSRNSGRFTSSGRRPSLLSANRRMGVSTGSAAGGTAGHSHKDNHVSHNTHLGLISGFVCMLVTIVTVTYYLSEQNRPGSDKKESKGSRILVLTSSSLDLFVFIAIVVAMQKMKKLGKISQAMRTIIHSSGSSHKVNNQSTQILGHRINSTKFHRHKMSERILLCVTYTGLLLYRFLTLIAVGFAQEDTHVYILVESMIAITSATVQTAFLTFVAIGKRSVKIDHVRMKPGRQCLNFIRIANFALWLLHTFGIGSSGANAAQYDFYGFTAWSILYHMCLPLMILFRFHSVVCTSNLVSKAYTWRYVVPDTGGGGGGGTASSLHHTASGISATFGMGGAGGGGTLTGGGGGSEITLARNGQCIRAKVTNLPIPNHNFNSYSEY